MGKLKKSRKHKKYNPITKLNQVVKYSLRNYGICWVGARNRKCLLGNLRTGAIVRPNPDQATALLELPFKYTVVCAVFCRDQLGTEYMRYETVKIRDKHIHTELFDLLTEIHVDLIKGVNQSHKITVGWLACPVIDTEIVPEDNLDKIFRAMGGFDYLAQWEIPKSEHKEAS